MGIVRNPGSRPRVELELHEHATVREYRELGVFIRDCIDRIERRLGRADSWSIKIAPERVCYACNVIVRVDGAVVQACGNGFDAAVAGWEAFRKIEGDLGSSRLRPFTCLQRWHRARTEGGPLCRKPY